MILIFGGTTEGRLAVDVCEQAGNRFYYSTKSSGQDIDMHNGVRLEGAMTSADIADFCLRHDICCIVDAAHPFATSLHQAINESRVPVIRLQRSFAPHCEGVVYCKSFEDAVERLKADPPRRLLALSGVNTIGRLSEYWREHDTVFRILDRQESIDIANRNHFPPNNLIYYGDTSSLPGLEDEKGMMTDTGCDAIITKESGTTGGYDTKIRAAQELGIRVFVVEHPRLPAHWTYVSGRHSLRRAIETAVPSFFPLHTGLTTGSCATAATRAAMLSLLFDRYPDDVQFTLPDGEVIKVLVCHEAKGIATVVKDFSDDPDTTKGCRITSKVEFADETCAGILSANEARASHNHQTCTGTEDDDESVITFLQGSGVGTVTLPGLGIPVGEPAINPTPRSMITNEIRSLTTRNINVTISVENGEELALRTFNHKVGVMGGISIIGTSGIVQPFSHEAFVSSIRRELDVAWAMGEKRIALVAGMKSETALKREMDIRCVHYGNFIGEALQAAHDTGFRHVVIAIMIGKAVKLAEGHLDTHSHKVEMNRDFLTGIARQLGIDDTPVNQVSMARHLWDVMPQVFFDRIADLCHKHCQAVFPDGEVHIRLITPDNSR